MSTAELTMTQDQIMNLPLDQLHADEGFNSRGVIDPFEIRELIESIAEMGLLEPIGVYPYNEDEYKRYNKKYKIIFGFCRYAAHKALKKETITCVVKPWMAEINARVLNIIENIRRKDLNILQEAKSLENFKNAGWTMDMVASKLKVSRSWVQNRYAVLSFPTDIQEECAKGTLNQIQIKEIYSLPIDDQYEAVRTIKDQRMKGEKNIKVKRSVRQNVKVTRSRGGIVKMKDLLYDTLGPSLATRFGAWMVGEISSMEFFIDVKKEAEAKGKHFVIPHEEFL